MHHLNIQLMIAVPEGRVRNIMPYMETSLLLVKKENRILTKTMIRDADRAAGATEQEAEAGTEGAGT